MQRCWNQDPHLRPEVSEAVQVLFAPLVFHSFWRPCIHLFDCIIMCSDTPAWKRLTSYPLSAHERTSLITSIFSDHN